MRRVGYAIWQLLTLLLVYLPVGIGGGIVLLLKVPRLSELMGEGTGAFTSWTFYRDALAVSFVLYFGSVLVGFVIVTTVPRLLNLLLRPDKVYRLYGFHYGVHRWIVRLTNAKFLSNLVGDSSWIVHYLRGIGYDLGKIVQTGANFGGNVKHESPYLSSVGTGTMVADALSMMNAEFSSTSFRLSRASIGARNFLGNGIAYPPRGRTGDNCLLATKVMVPISGRVRENVGLLGSPPFEIPRSVERDSSFDHLKQGDEFRRRLAAKNRHNFVTILWCLFARWFFVFLLTVLTGHRRGLLRLIGCGGDRVGTRALRCARHRLLDPGRTDRDRVQAPARAVLLDLRARDVAPRTVLESALDRVSRGLRRHPVHQHDPAPSGHPDRPPGFQRRLRYARSGRSSPSATTARSTR